MYNEKEMELIKRFNAFVRKCIKNFSINYDRDEKKKWYNNTIFYDDFSEIENILPYEVDVAEHYISGSKIFNVDGIPIEVNGDELIAAIDELPQELKTIILLYYFERESDEKIAKHLNMVRKNINRKRRAALVMLKNIMSLCEDKS